MAKLDAKISKNGAFYQCKNFYSYLKHPEKYLREDKVITARSGLEMDYFKKFDMNASIISWDSENIVIPYPKPIFDNVGHIIKYENRKYYPDIYLKVRKKDGSIEEIIGEIKPMKQVIKPELGKRNTEKGKKNFINEKCRWYINALKWKAANGYAKIIREKYNRNINFYIFTENKIVDFKDILL